MWNCWGVREKVQVLRFSLEVQVAVDRTMTYHDEKDQPKSEDLQKHGNTCKSMIPGGFHGQFMVRCFPCEVALRELQDDLATKLHPSTLVPNLGKSPRPWAIKGWNWQLSNQECWNWNLEVFVLRWDGCLQRIVFPGLLIPFTR